MSKQVITATDIYTQNLEATGTVDATALNIGGNPAATNPMTTSQDLIVGGANGVPTRLGKGADGQVLTVDPATHLLVWAPPSAGSNINEVQAGALINATSAGDAGGRADQFAAAGLDPKWTVYGGATVTVKNSCVVIASGAVESGLWEAYTPSGACRVVVRCSAAAQDASDLLGFQIAAAGAAPTDYVRVDMFGGTYRLSTLDAGVFNSRATLPRVTQAAMYLALARDAGNNWTAQLSPDRAAWSTIGTFAKALAVNAIRLMSVTNTGLPVAFDLVDVEL